jgi:hypothetical protein
LSKSIFDADHSGSHVGEQRTSRFFIDKDEHHENGKRIGPRRGRDRLDAAGWDGDGSDRNR